MPRAEAALAAACAHCGLPVPAGRADGYCCGGCETVAGVLRASGLTRYYELLAASSAGRRPAVVTGRSFAELDDAAFAARAAEGDPRGFRSCDLYVEGVHCAACVWLVERVPSLVPGVVEVRLDLPRAKARVVWDPERATLSQAARALDRLGYGVHPYRASKVAALRRREDRALLIKIGVSGAIAANVMAMAFALYGGLLHGIDPAYARFFRWTSASIAIPSVFWCGGVFFRGAFGGLRAKALHMDVPISIALVAGFLHGAANTVRGTGEVYFDAVTALVFLLLAGRYVRRSRQRAAAEAAELLSSLAPSVARRIEGDAIREVPIEALLLGDRVEVRAGDTLPADGRIESGRSSVDAALLTGESRPVEVSPGDAVHAGTVNLSERLAVLVEAAGEDTRVGRLMRLVEEHGKRRPPIVQLADRIAGRFTLAVLLLSAATLALWWRISPQAAFDNAVALLIVTCPCALGLATPLALAAAVGRAARAGFLVRGADAIEALSGRGTVVVDKTGTLTEGRLAVVSWWGDPEAGALAAAAEAHSSHPVARALAAAHMPASGPVDVEESRGGGVAGRVGRKAVVVGSPAFVGGRVGALDGRVVSRIDAFTRDGLTPVVVAIDSRVAAVAGLADPIRPDAAEALRRLEGYGWRPRVLSGDHAGVVASVAGALGVPPASARGGASPEDKIAAILDARAGGPVMMVGDGVNDAGALAASTVGVAVHGGAEAALASSDVFVTRPGIVPVADLVDGARRTMAVVRRNLAFSLVYNVAGVALAMTGVINPLIAAILMPVSSLTVIASSALANTFPNAKDPTWR